MLDAFSSDAIPTHLLTREALRGYLAHLTPHGVIVMHISNRHMELAKVVAAVGAAEGLVTVVKADDKATQFVTDFHAAALVAALARDAADLGRAERCAMAGGARMPARSLPGPTTIPTSSARSCARRWDGNLPAVVPEAAASGYPGPSNLDSADQPQTWRDGIPALAALGRDDASYFFSCNAACCFASCTSKSFSSVAM